MSGGMKTWLEWEELVKEGVAKEPSGEFHSPIIVFYRPSDIECPVHFRVGGKWRQCKAKLNETNIIVECGTERRRVMKCPVCDKWSCRLCGKEGSCP